MVDHEFWLHPSQHSQTAWPWFGYLTCLNSCHSDTLIICLIGKITPHWVDEGIIEALWGEELVPWLALGKSSIFAHLCPLLSCLVSQTLSGHCEYLKVRDYWLLMYASLTTSRECLLLRSNTAWWLKAGILAPNSPREAWCYHFPAVQTWGNYLRSLWLGFIIWQVGIIIVPAS